jgi:glutamate formiminotransferase
MTEAYNAVMVEADKLVVEIASAVIVVLVPRDALDRNAAFFSRLENFNEGKILENQIEKCG